MKYASRKFIDLIHTTTSKWANWDPPRAIRVGDFGKINRETGEFEWQGNIYDNSFQEQFGDPLGINLLDVDLQPVTQEKTDDHIIACSRGATVKVVDLSVGVGVQDVASVKLQVNCQFTSKCSAALVVYKPQLSYLPRDQQLMRLLKEFQSVLKGRYIVTEVTLCPAYVLAMSTEGAESFSASLDAGVPVLSGISLGGAAKGGWTADAIHGIWRSGHDTLPIYCPLYKLKQPPPSFWELIYPRRGDTKQSDSVDDWDDVRPPWDPLDEEGEEDEIYDAALEGEELDWDN